MPATYAAVAAALAAATDVEPHLAPTTQLDVGGGTGAALWAAADAFPTLTSATVLDASESALQLGRRLATGGSDVVAAATWTRAQLGVDVELPSADLVSLTYVLGELAERVRADVLAEVARRGHVVVVVEPGTPAGYRRVLEARGALIGAGFRIVAPCPHERTCPLAGTDDWCHFAIRLTRSPRHRRAKSAVLGHEDEKLSYVVAVSGEGPRSGNRILRRPEFRKGLVELVLCTFDDGVRRTRVTKRDGASYRAARNAAWNDEWEAARE